jgi:predicted nucleic acid-binding protein
MVVLDTNIIIDHLRQSKKKETHLTKIAKQKPKEELAISMVSVQELYEGKSTKDKEREGHLLATIVNGAQLFTLNKKDFRGIEVLEFFD